MTKISKQNGLIGLLAIAGLIFTLQHFHILDKLIGYGHLPSNTASRLTENFQEQTKKTLPLEDQTDFINASRGFIAKPSGKILDKDGNIIWDFDRFEWIKDSSPPSVNPSLWRHAKLNNHFGLFEVTQGIYQLRGFDLANMTLIQGKTGWIVVDPLTSEENAKAAFSFANEKLGKQTISAMIFTHSHADHFGGAQGILTEEEVTQKKIMVIAPVGFLEEATSENVLLSAAMGRRASWQFGYQLPAQVDGVVDAGLGKAVSSGHISILHPNLLIRENNQKILVDGVPIIFNYTPAAEAPAELTFYLPDQKALCTSELAVHTMHNFYTLRGAKIRNPLIWTSYLNDMRESYPDKEILFASHEWPIWGKDEINYFLKAHQDSYQYIHDQTVRMMNQGMNSTEIAETIRLPSSLNQFFSTRGYYGSINTNVKAVYQFYLGWFDGNPAHLNPLSAKENSQKYVTAMGGSAKVIEHSRDSFNKGEYRWAAELLNHVVISEPKNQEARILLASSYKELGFQAESSIWRNFYLSAASELNGGEPQTMTNPRQAFGLIRNTPVEQFLQVVASNINGPKAEDLNLTFNLHLTDTNTNYVLWIENAVLHFKKAPETRSASFTLSLTQEELFSILTGQTTMQHVMLKQTVGLKGSKVDLFKFLSLLDKPNNLFPIVTRPTP
jgi:alkyl sulfatase BDS1-like metallo-beta-lactamase superfamily hydrolase